MLGVRICRQCRWRFLPLGRQKGSGSSGSRPWGSLRVSGPTPYDEPRRAPLPVPAASLLGRVGALGIQAWAVEDAASCERQWQPEELVGCPEPTGAARPGDYPTWQEGRTSPLRHLSVRVDGIEPLVGPRVISPCVVLSSPRSGAFGPGPYRGDDPVPRSASKKALR